MNLLEVLSSKIRFLRKQRGLTQEQLAEMVELQPNTISYIETGRGFMTVENVEKVAEALKVHPSELYITADLTSKEHQELKEIILEKLNKFDTKELLFFAKYLDLYSDTHYGK